MNRSYSWGTRKLESREFPTKRMDTKRNSLSIEDEISVLKREKQNLFQEKSLLKAKIIRLKNKMGKAPQKQRPMSRSHPFQNSLENELKRLKQLSASKRTEIDSIKQSDRAALIGELQEECIILHEEIIRMKYSNKSFNKQTKELHKKLLQTQSEFSESVYSKQKKEINNLHLEIDKQKQRNAVISLKLMKKEHELDSSDERKTIMQNSYSEIDNKIKQEQDQVKQIEDDIKTISQKGEERVKELEERLRNVVSAN